MRDRPLRRCAWAESDPATRAYHDEEWGFPVRDSRGLWERLMLEGFRIGLSSASIRTERDALREAFAGFDPHRIARFGAGDVARLRVDPGLARAHVRIAATITGARRYEEEALRGEDFAHRCWSYTDGRVLVVDEGNRADCDALAQRIARDLKKRGFALVGPAIAGAWAKAVGLVDDHDPACFRRVGPPP